MDAFQGSQQVHMVYPLNVQLPSQQYYLHQGQIWALPPGYGVPAAGAGAPQVGGGGVYNWAPSPPNNTAVGRARVAIPFPSLVPAPAGVPAANAVAGAGAPGDGDDDVVAGGGRGRKRGAKGQAGPRDKKKQRACTACFTSRTVPNRKCAQG